MSDSDLEDRLDCINRNIARFRSDIRQIVREEVKSIVEDAISEFVEELRKPPPYIERGYRP